MRAFTVDNLKNKKFNIMQFGEQWFDSFGNPERSGHWTIWGQSGGGKTTFLLLLAKYLSGFDRVIYNSREEGLSATLQIAVKRVGFAGIWPGRLLFTAEDMNEQNLRLSRKKSQNIIINDSIQEMNFAKCDYITFKEKFSNKLLIWVSQSTPNGKQPSNNLGQFIRHSSDVKIHIAGYMAFVTSRYAETEKPFVIWEQGARQFYGMDYENSLTNTQNQKL